VEARLLEYYNRELQFMREMGAEFARAYPRVAARLGIDGVECADPYVERLLEGFAFLAARIQLKLDARHPDFTQQLLELIYPTFLAPIPSAAIAEFVPDLEEGSLKEGLLVRRGSSVTTPLGKGERTALEFRTAHDVTLWPITVNEVKYLSGAGALSMQGLSVDAHARAAIRLRLKAAPGVSFASMPLDGLDFYIKATSGIASRIHEQIHANCIGLCVRAFPSSTAASILPSSGVVEIGFEDAAAMLPLPRAGYAGFRLLQEYFMLPERFMFFGLRGLRPALRACATEEVEVFILLDRAQGTLENALDASQFRLNCTPIINLFPKSCDRLELTGHDVEQHVVPDRNRPQDFEIYSLERVTGILSSGEGGFPVAPFYSATHRSAASEQRAYYTLQRRRRLLSTRQRRTGERASYVGSECFISIVDSGERIQRGEARQADVQALCTNRDLPIQATFGRGRTDFLLAGGAPISSIRCITGPTMPRVAPAEGEAAWRLISHLSLNYLSIESDGIDLLRDFLALYADQNDSVAARQIEGVRNIGFAPVVRRLPVPGPISHGRGLRITLTLDDAAFEGAGLLPLAAVLERFFRRYVSLNSFTQLRLQSASRGEIKQWPVRLGTRHVL
jgi:type VI secretion system protein ImpG